MSTKKLESNEKNIGMRLKNLREQYFMRQKEFSNSLGISQGTYSEIESGKRYPTKTQLIVIENRYNINPNWLLTGEGEKYKKTGVSDRSKNHNVTKLPDIPVEKIKMWLDEFWRDATPRQKAWLEIEFERMFPEYKAWLEKKEQDSEPNDTPPQGYNNTA